MGYACDECFEKQICSACKKQLCHYSQYRKGCEVKKHYRMISPFLTKRISPLLCVECQAKEVTKKMY